jgi:hypothetical protein
MSAISGTRGVPAEAHPPIRLAGSLLGEHRHVCAFFNSREDEYRITLPFIKDGFDNGDRACHLIGSDRADDHLERLTGAGIDTVTARRTGQFDLVGWDETYFSGGYFDPDRWLALVEEELANGSRRGFPRSRFLAHMEWALEDCAGVDRIVEYEARVNYVLPRYKEVSCICTYDLSRWSADVIINIMRTHPMVIVGGLLQQNPFYVPPDRFLEELHARGAPRAASSPAAL